MVPVAENVAAIKERISQAARRAGRFPNQVRLVAVSKTVPVELIRQAVEAGADILGENYVQEALAKMEALDLPARWHFIGHLQSNKARQVVGRFELIHSVDSFKLARELSRRALGAGQVMEVLIQVNVSGEQSKFGISPEQLRPLLDQVAPLEGIRVKGLMTMPPYFDQPERCRPFFRKLRELAASIGDDYLPRVCMEELSMGMSGDFEVAIEEGATLVRVGTSIFGPRSY